MTVDGAGLGRVIVLIPAFNEQDCIAAIIGEVRNAAPEAEILVINDASTDATAGLATAAGAEVLDLADNQGAGAAMRAGYRFASTRGFDVAVRIDADGQHNPRDIALLLAGLCDGADLVIGSRFSGDPGYSVGFGRRWATRRLSTQVTRLTGLQVTDTTSGYRAAGRRAILFFAQETDPQFLGDTVTALVTASAAGLRVVEVPVRMRARQGGRASLGLLPSARGFWRMYLSLRSTGAVDDPRPSEPVGIVHTSEDS